MSRNSITAAFVLPLIAAVLTVGCKSGREEGKRLKGGGATFVDPIMQKWSSEYNTARGVEIDYSKSGSSDGIKQMTERNLDFGCSDAPMKKDQVEAAAAKGGEVIHVPLIMGAVALAYNLPDVPNLKLSGPVLADIYLGKIKKWNDEPIAKLNPGVSLPDLGITPVYRQEGSGTSNIYTEYLSKVCSVFAQKIGSSTKPKWPVIGVGKKVNDGVAGHVKKNVGCIGYVEVAYAKLNSIPVAAIKNAKDAFVLPETEAVSAAAEWAMAQPQNKEPYSLHELTYSLTNAETEKSYPICGFSYGLLYKKQPEAKGKALVEFLKWATSDGQKFAAELHYAPLPADLGKKVADRLSKVEFTN
jgi:phosphate transport system substrate-binding protein